MSMIKYRVHEVAKDFNTTSKVITQILTDYATTPKNHMQVLENNELDVIFEYLTQHNQAESLADIFELDPSLVKVLPHEAHEEYSESTKYTSRGNGGLSCSGTFTSFARAIMAAKNLVRDFSLSKAIMLGSSALGLLLVLVMVLLREMTLLTPSVITLYNTVAVLAMMAVQNVRKY